MKPDEQDKDFPWWLLIAAGLAAWMLWSVVADDLYRQVLGTLSRGIWITVFVTPGCVLFGLGNRAGAGQCVAIAPPDPAPDRAVLYRNRTRHSDPCFAALRSLCSGPGTGCRVWNWVTGALGLDPIRNRDFPLLWRAVLALTIGYSAFIAEVFRAGLQSAGSRADRGGAGALGLTGWQRFRHIVFPQAIRTILPPLGNDFVAMIKDSSLVSVLGVLDITQLGKLTAAGNFLYFETYNVVALIYLIMTVTLSLLLRRLEARMRSRHG